MRRSTASTPASARWPRRRFPRDALGALQLNLLRSHAAGVGEPLPVRAVRASMALRANVLAKGFSGIRRSTLDLLHRACSIAACTRACPSRGSVGASGDLAPLAHLSLVLIGEGEATVGEDTTVLRGREALARSRPVARHARRRRRGSRSSTARSRRPPSPRSPSLGAERLGRAADIAAALSIDALRGSTRPFDPRIHAARPHAGQRASAANIFGAARRQRHQPVARALRPRAGRVLAAVCGADTRCGARCARVRRATTLDDRGQCRHRQPHGLRRGR